MLHQMDFMDMLKLVYGICGGNMYLLLELYNSYISGGTHLSKSFYIYQAHLRLLKAMSPDNLFYQDLLKSIPNWTREELIDVSVCRVRILVL